MEIPTRNGRDELVERAQRHEGSEVLEAVNALRGDIATLRGMVHRDDEPMLTPSARRMIAQVAAVVVLVGGVMAAGLVWQGDRQAAAFRRGYQEGYRAYAAVATPVETLTVKLAERMKAPVHRR
jgi:hypothetical protein